MKRTRDESGQSLIELALALPMLVFLLMGGTDFARALSTEVGVQNAARVGAEAAAARAPGVTQPVPNDDAATIAYAREEFSRVPGVDSSAAATTITVRRFRADGVTACLNPPTTAVPCYVTVRVQYTFRTVVPWPLLPNTIALDNAVQFRTYP